MKRQFDPAEPELMDLPQPVTAELETDLRNIRRLNRFFGGHSLVSRFLRDWIRPRQTLHVLDLATGSGDIPRLIVDYARQTRRADKGRSGRSTGFHARDCPAIKRELSRDHLSSGKYSRMVERFRVRHRSLHTRACTISARKMRCDCCAAAANFRAITF